MLSNLKVATRLGLGFGVVGAMLLMISVASVQRLATVNQSSVLIIDDLYPQVALAEEIEKGALDNARLVRNALLATNSADAEKSWTELQEGRAGTSDRMKKLEALLTTEKGKELFKNIGDRRMVTSPMY